VSSGDNLDATLYLPDESRPQVDPRAGSESWSVPGYRILRKLGEGGMGAVYEAAQEQPSRLVALKVLSSSASEDPYRRRLFAREIEMLARMQHPGIASIYEAGQVEAVGSYFTMELVKGCRLDEYSKRVRDRNRLLILFLQICDAVKYAHEQGVIHRDLKPANVMVTEEGERAKVLDFGLARALESEGAQLSWVGTVAGTLRYMSPEQANGGSHPGTGTDQYSLGIILYELLTSMSPYDLQDMSMLAAVKVIQETPPRRTTLPEDLELIIRKALAKDPSQRYSSVSAFADDLRRYQRGEPVVARPPNLWYQVRLGVKRHRVASALSAVLLLTLIGGVAALSVFNRRLVTERNRAEQISSFLLRIFENGNPGRGGGERITAREILDNGRREVEAQLASQPELRANLMGVIGDSYRRLGIYEQSDEVLSKALEHERSLHGERSLEAVHAMIRLGDLMRDRGRFKDAEPLLAEALKVSREVSGENSLATAGAMNAYAVVLEEAGRPKDALPLCERALAIRDRQLGADHDDTIVTLGNLGAIHQRLSHFEVAEPMFRRAYNARVRTLGEKHLAVASSAGRLARLYEQMRRHAEAEALHRQSLRLREELLSPDHPATAATRSDLASSLQDRGRYDEAEPLYRKAIESAIKTAGAESRVTAVNLNNLAYLLDETGRYDEAAELFERSINIRKKIFGEKSPLVIRVVDSLARTELARSRLPQCERLLNQILDDPAVKLTAVERAAPMLTRARLRARQGRLDEAELLMREVSKVYREQTRENSPQRGFAADALGNFLLEQKRFQEAAPLLVEAHRIWNESYGPERRRTVASLAALERCRQQMRNQ